MTTTPPEAPSEEPAGVRITMHGESHDSSTLIQIGTQNIHHHPLPPSGLEIRYSLPPDPVAFTGRDDELRRITDSVTDVAGPGGIVAIHAIGGMPGIGKTALAVRAAHLLRDRFGDRQLFIDLHAHTPGQDPVTPQDALAGLLAATGVDPRYLPADLDGRISLWRDRMAGQRALLVLDNAAASAQVSPLLPGGGSCLVLVTSRRHLGDLPGAVFPVQLDILSPHQAREMFVALAPRAAAQPEAVQELVRLAGYLPLAISLLARVYARHPPWTVDHLIGETRSKLLTITAENRTIAAAFDLSYQYLTADQQRFFRQLGLHPGVDVDPYGAAAITGVRVDEAIERLDVLHSDRLLAETAYRRYRMHDLIREYARARAASSDTPDACELAVDRLLDYYQYTAETADAHLACYTRPTAGASVNAPAETPELPDRERAEAWLTVERANLIACINYAGGRHQLARVVGITAAIAAHLESSGPWTAAITLHGAAAAAAQQLGDALGEANALHQLGIAQRLACDYLDAVGTQEQALAIYCDIGDRLGEANAIYESGAVRFAMGGFSEARQIQERALGIYRDIGNRLGEAYTLNDLGAVTYAGGDFSGAYPFLEQGLAISHTLGDELGEANALYHLGNVRYETGDYLAANVTLEKALDLIRSLGIRVGEANTLDRIGAVRCTTGDYHGADACLLEALTICRDLGSRLGEANALTL